MMKTTKKSLATCLAIAALTVAAPAYAGKNSTPGVTTATTSLSAVPPASSAQPSASGGSTGGYAVGSSFAASPGEVNLITTAPSAVQTTRNGAPVTELTVILPSGETAVLVLSEDGEVTILQE